MTSSPDPIQWRAKFEQRLFGARDKVWRATARSRLPSAMEHALLGMTGVAGGYLLWRCACAVVERGSAIGWPVVMVLMVLALLLPPLLIWARVRRQIPTWEEAAERLDVGAGQHNRIAIALALLGRTDTGPFAAAAVQDGWKSLQSLEGEQPRVPSTPIKWRRLGSYAVVCLVIIALTVLVGEYRALLAFENRQPLLADQAPVRRPSGEGDGLDDAQEVARVAAARRVARSTAAGGRSESSAEHPPQERRERRDGPGGGGVAGRARTPSEPLASTGNPSAAAASSKSRESVPSSRKTTRDRPSRHDESGPRSKADSSSQIRAGSSGAGAMSPTEHDWALRANPAGSESQEDESDEEVEDERDASTQRGGIQPSLKDRAEAPSRDLGISGEQGPPGAGRGGPTPPKKSRGTASLVLGVPVPDFVRGRVGPGTTKITHQLVDPTLMPGVPIRHATGKPRSLPESPCRRFDVPNELAPIVRAYLVAIHSADQSAATEESRQEPSPE